MCNVFVLGKYTEFNCNKKGKPRKNAKICQSDTYKTTKAQPKLCLQCCGDRRDRTFDLLVNGQLLCLLSYVTVLFMWPGSDSNAQSSTIPRIVPTRLPVAAPGRFSLWGRSESNRQIKLLILDP